MEVDLNSTTWTASQFVTVLQQSYCDVILTYAHPAMDYLSPLEIARCESILLTTDQFIPVSIPDETGKPRFALPHSGKRSLPLLNYGTASGLRTVLDFVLAQSLDPPAVLSLNQSSQSNSVKAMILEGFGIGWLPQAVCQAELDSGQLVVAGPKEFETTLEIRAYIFQDNKKQTLGKFWKTLRKNS
jgi:DNA-binding transcriptional LysR family regulator